MLQYVSFPEYRFRTAFEHVATPSLSSIEEALIETIACIVKGFIHALQRRGGTGV